MHQAPKRKLFISHSADDKGLALMVKSLFESRLGSQSNPVSVFCSSDIKSIEGGKEWFDEIMHALRTSQVCVSLMTPHSIYRPWVLFESGGAYTLSMADRKHLRMFPVCAYGMKAAILPGPFTLLQARHLDSKSEVKQLCQEVGGVFGTSSCRVPGTAIDRVCKEAARGTGLWENVHATLVGDRLDSSPFSADHLLHDTQEYFFAAGQNLHHLATSASFKRQLFCWLREQSGRRAQLLICDPGQGDAVAALNVVGHNYPQDLWRSVDQFQKWLKDAKAQGLEEAVDIRVTRLVTASVVCVDPEGQNGTLVLTPVVFGKPISGERPHVVFTRSNTRRAFDHYWETYRDVFTRGRSVIGVRRTPNYVMQGSVRSTTRR